MEAIAVLDVLRSVIPVAIACAVTIAYVRVLSSVSRWIALGPGPVATRAIVGPILLSLSYALAIAPSSPFVAAFLTLDGLAWVAYPIAFQLTWWAAAAALGERDFLGDWPVERQRFGLRDALLALGLFGIAAAAFRVSIGSRHIASWNEWALSDALAWGPVLSLLLLVFFCIDAGTRVSFARERKSLTGWGRSDLVAITALGPLGLAMLTAVLTAFRIPAFLIAILGMLAVYTGASIAQEALVRALGVTTMNVWTATAPPTDESDAEAPT